MPETTDGTDEIVLLTCSPVLHRVAMEQLAEVLRQTVTTINGQICFLAEVRIDEEEHRIYGRGHSIPTYGEYV